MSQRSTEANLGSLHTHNRCQQAAPGHIVAEGKPKITGATGSVTSLDFCQIDTFKAEEEMHEEDGLYTMTHCPHESIFQLFYFFYPLSIPEFPFPNPVTA